MDKHLQRLIAKGRAVASCPGRLHCASCPRTAHALVVLGADIESVDKQGRTPLQVAFVDNRRAVAVQLLEDGAKADGEMLLRECVAGDINMVGLLLKGGAPVGARDKTGCSPLHHAADAGHTEIVRLLTNAGADVNDRGGIHNLGRQPLHNSCLSGRAKVVRLLLSAGAEADTPDHTGLTPLCYATIMRRHEIIAVLLAAGASPHKKPGQPKLPSAPADRTTDPTIRELFGA